MVSTCLGLLQGPDVILWSVRVTFIAVPLFREVWLCVRKRKCVPGTQAIRCVSVHQTTLIALIECFFIAEIPYRFGFFFFCMCVHLYFSHLVHHCLHMWQPLSIFLYSYGAKVTNITELKLYLSTISLYESLGLRFNKNLQASFI